MKTATVHARIDPQTKRESEMVLHQLGLTPTDAVRLLYRQIAIRKEFPLELKIPNDLTAQTLAQTDKGENLETFDSLEDFKKSWE
ncbi:MAG: type II toxin-antitoxin system RelB/DinJ family antitoxin [Verrucomicrobiota bacterium]